MGNTSGMVGFGFYSIVSYFGVVWEVGILGKRLNVGTVKAA